MKFNVQLNVQPVILRMVALALATLMVILAIGGIRAIARVNETESAPIASQPGSSPALTEWSVSQEKGKGSASPSPAASPTPATQSPAAKSLPTVKASPIAPPSTTSASSANARSAPSTQTPSYEPRQEVAFADPTNYGDRYATDIYGNPVNNDWLIVLHETVGTADSAIQTFQARHTNEDDQVSYHTLIRQDGTVVYIVPPEKRAFGAGNSAFEGANGVEAVRTDPNFPPSVNNFAYHISLETPPDGHNNNSTHSGYTREQYQTLAWLIARTPVPNDRITTHAAIDQSGSRMDPRSFNAPLLLTYLQTYPNRNPNVANQ